MQRVRKTDGTAVSYDYRYQVKNQESGNVEVFQTVGDPISDYSALHLFSCGTRAWECKKIVLDGNGDPTYDEGGDLVFEEGTFAVKDTWLRMDRLLDSEIQNAIFSALGDEAEDARQYFLTILSEGVVQIGGETPYEDVTPFFDGENTTPARESTTDDVHELPSKPFPPPPYGPRKHVRTVFKERCMSVYELTDFRCFFLCMQGCVQGLRSPRSIVRISHAFTAVDQGPAPRKDTGCGIPKRAKTWRCQPNPPDLRPH